MEYIYAIHTEYIYKIVKRWSIHSDRVIFQCLLVSKLLYIYIYFYLFCIFLSTVSNFQHNVYLKLLQNFISYILQVKYEVVNPSKDKNLFILAFALCGGVAGILLAVAAAYLVRKHSRSREKLQNVAQADTEPSQDYQVPLLFYFFLFY